MPQMNLYTKTVVELKEILRNYGLPVSGNKSVLIQRIQREETLGFEDFPDEEKNDENVDEEIGGYIKMYQTGAPDYFFWNKSDAENYVDDRDRKVRAIVAIPKVNVQILQKAKRKDAYYAYEKQNQTKVFAVLSSQQKIKQFSNTKIGRTLGEIKFWPLTVNPKSKCISDEESEEKPKKRGKSEYPDQESEEEPKNNDGNKYYVAYLMMDSEIFIEGIFDSFALAKEKLQKNSGWNKILKFTKHYNRWSAHSSNDAFYIEEKILNM